MELIHIINGLEWNRRGNRHGTKGTNWPGSVPPVPLGSRIGSVDKLFIFQ